METPRNPPLAAPMCAHKHKHAVHTELCKRNRYIGIHNKCYYTNTRVHTHTHILRLCLAPGNKLFYESTSILMGGIKVLPLLPPFISPTLPSTPKSDPLRGRGGGGRPGHLKWLRQ